MTLNFGQNLYPQRPEFIQSLDFADVLRGQSYIEFFAGQITPEQESTQESYETNDDEDINIGGNANLKAAQTFTTTEKMWITSIELRGTDLVSDVTADIEYTTAGEPNGILLGRLALFDLAGDTVWVRTELSNPIEIEAGTYAIVIHGTGTVNGIKLRADGSSPTYTGGSVFTSSDFGSSWSVDTSKDMMFIVNGITSNPYLLFPETFETNNATFVIDINDLITTETLRGEINYDLEVGKAMIIQGKALLEFKWTAFLQVNNSGDLDSFIRVKIIKEREGTETVIGTTDTVQEFIADSSDTTRVNRETVLIDCTRTALKTGDTLRLSLEGTVTDHNEEGAANNEISSLTFAQNPEDGDNANDMKLKLPFKLD